MLRRVPLPTSGYTFAYLRVHLSLPKGIPFPTSVPVFSFVSLSVCISVCCRFLFLHIGFVDKIIQINLLRTVIFKYWPILSCRFGLADKLERLSVHIGHVNALFKIAQIDRAALSDGPYARTL